MTMRRALPALVAALTVAVAASAPLYARSRFQGYAERGGLPVITSGIPSTTKVQQSYPSSTVTVYLTGTLTLATLYSDAAGTLKANPFAADSAAHWDAYIDDGTYDVKFSGAGIAVPFTISGISVGGAGVSASVTGFGAKCDAATDDTTAFQAAAAFTGTAHQITIPAATCVLTDTVTTSQSGTNWVGAGRKTTFIRFAPTLAGGKIAFDIKDSGSGEQFQNSIRDLSFISSDTTYAKTAIRLTDTGQTVIENVTIGPIGFWTDAGKGSIGLLIRGREEGYYHLSDNAADKPIVISDNPNATIDLDHWHFQDLNLIADSNPIITVDTGVNITNLLFDGYQAWNKGTYGFYFNDTTTIQSGQMASFNNVRWEQPQSAVGYAIYWHSNALFRNLLIMNCMTGSGASNHGFLAQNVNGVDIIGSNFSGTGGKTAFNVDNSDQVMLLNNFWNSGSVSSKSGLCNPLGMGDFVSGPTPGLAFEYWVKCTNQSGPQLTLTGTKHRSYAGTIASGALSPIPDITSPTARGRIFVSYRGATTDGVCEIGLTPVSTYTIGNGGTNCSAGNVGGKFCVLFTGPAAINLLNNLAESVNYTVELDWTP